MLSGVLGVDNLTVFPQYSSQVKGNDKIMSLSTCKSSFDTQISIFAGSSCNRMSCIGNNDQRTACGAFGDQSHVTWFADIATEFYVLVHGVRDSMGQFELSVEEMESHSQCANAVSIEDYEPGTRTGVARLGSTLVAPTQNTTLPDLPLCEGIPVIPEKAVGVWYTFTATGAGFTQVQVSDFAGAKVYVYSGNDCGSLSCVTASTTDTAFWTTIVDETYFMYVHGGVDDSGEAIVGDFTLTLQPGGALKLDAATPPNVECSTASSLSFSEAGEDGIIRVTNSTHLSQVAPIGSCGPGVQSTAKGVWYDIMGTGKGITASICESIGFQAQISVFGGDSCDNLKCIGGQAYSAAPCSGSFSWFSEIGLPYKILIHGLESRVGEFALTLKETELPSRDSSSCNSAIGPIAANGVTLLGSTANADAFDVECGQSSSVGGVWHSVLGTGSKLVASTCSSDPSLSDDLTEVRIAILSGSCDSLNCVEETQSVPCGNGQMSAVWESVVGVEYFVVVYSLDQTAFTLSIDEAPLNIMCSKNLPLIAADGSSTFGYTSMVIPSSAGTSGGPDCVALDGDDGFGLGLWYQLPTENTGRTWTLSSCSEFTSFEAKLSVFAGDGCGNLRCIGSNNGLACGRGSTVSWEDSLTMGESFYVFVSGSQDFGNIALSLGPENNVCEVAIPILADGSVVKGSTVGASTDDPDLRCFSTGTFVSGPGVWYQVTGSGSVLTATTCGPETDFDTRISVFQSADESCENLSCVSGNDNDEQCAASLSSSVSWYAGSGELFFILVHGVEAGNFGLSVNETPNDTCEAAFPTASSDDRSSIPAVVTNSSIMVSYMDPCNSTNSPATELQAWFSVPGTGSNISVSAYADPACSSTNVSSSESLPIVSVFRQGCGSSTCADYVEQGLCTAIFPSVFGEVYNVAVRIPSAEISAGDTEFDLVVSSSNDVCEDSFGPLVVGKPVFGSNFGSTSDMDRAGSCEALKGAVVGNGVWYSLVGTGQTVTAHTCSEHTDFDTQITVFAGEDCSSLSCINFKDNNCGKRSWVTFDTRLGDVYKILVSGSGTSEGRFVLEVF